MNALEMISYYGAVGILFMCVMVAFVLFCRVTPGGQWGAPSNVSAHEAMMYVLRERRARRNLIIGLLLLTVITLTFISGLTWLGLSIEKRKAEVITIESKYTTKTQKV